MGSWFSSEYNPGDLIEIFHIGYQHWALYVGRGYVIHLAPLGGFPTADSIMIASGLSVRGKVKKELLTDVAGNCRYRVNNELDNTYKPRPVKEILRSAYDRLGEEEQYNILMRNCEHFVTQLRYGEARSLQVENVLMGAGLTGALSAAAALGYAVMRN
ncbi:phospholipase A and acyltransferase 4 [Desmodus rotundus]|uniref:phospholipase A and acyltransferase 4 n=1 Tax=Desmodus rotundus TaxID=9430 RepID=UPI0023813550|nr:phospholipase A and acyltransferase 4 [Desmodus rotundus]